MKTTKIIYYLSTGLLTLLMLFSVSQYFFNYEDIADLFKSFGYPTYIIYPYGIIKLLGLLALWFVANKSIKEWAYAGFFFAFVLAFFAHYMIGDGDHLGALVATVLLLTSYFSSKKLNK
ncbi:MAG: DoxX family protein [Polaribacter sp.]